MSFRFKPELALLMGFALAFLILPQAFATDIDWLALSQGKVVVKQNAAAANTPPSVEAKILIPKPPEKVWSVVSNPEKLMHEERKVKKVKILSQSGNCQQVAFSVFMTPIFPTFNYVLQQDLLAPNSVRFHRISGSFRDIQGFWHLAPADGGRKTILTYNLMLDAGPLIPRSMLMGAVKADLPNMMQSAKRAIDLNTN